MLHDEPARQKEGGRGDEGRRSDTRPGLNDQLSLLFECPICVETYRDPRLLPACMHTFCRACIRQLALTALTEDSPAGVTCPLCRSTVPLPPQTSSSDIDDVIERLFPVNLFVVNATDVVTKAMSQFTISKTGYKMATNNNNNNGFRFNAVGGNGELSDDSDEAEVVGDDVINSVCCRKHAGCPYTLFCHDPECLKPICLVCALVYHRHHR